MLSGCRESALDQCRVAFAEEKFEAATWLCSRVFDKEADPRAGILAARAADRLGKKEEVLSWVDRLNSYDQSADVWHLVGRIREKRGEKHLANQAYRWALELHQKAGDGSSASEDAYRLLSLHWRESQYRKALHFGEIAYTQATNAQDRDLRARALLGLVAILYDTGDWWGAERALKLAGEITDQSHRYWAHILFNQGLLHQARNRNRLARRAYQEALKVAAEHDMKPIRAAQLNLVMADLSLGDLDAASVHLQQLGAISTTQSRSDGLLMFVKALEREARGQLDAAAKNLRKALQLNPTADWEWEMADALGRVLQKRGDWNEAENAFLRSIDVLEKLRHSLESDELRFWLLDKKRRPYEGLFLLYAGVGRVMAALDTIERAKARTFLDAFIHHATGSEKVALLGTFTKRAADRVDSIRNLLPSLRASKTVMPRSALELVKVIGDRNVLVFFETQKGFWLLRLVQGKMDLKRIDASPPKIVNLVKRFLAAPDDVMLAEELRALLLPESSLPPPESVIHLVTDGVLGRLPFAALRIGGKSLVSRNVLVYCPSVSALAAMLENRKEHPAPPIILADARGDLPSAASEAKEVASLLGVVARCGSAADSRALLEAKSASVLHLAVHVGIDRGAWVELSDEKVHSESVLARGLSPKLVVLASCASGARRGKGMWGSLGAAFLASGSRSVLATLWSVEDESTRRFIVRFYKEGGIRDPAGALARTQRAFEADGQPPSRWAQFVLFGSIETSLRERSEEP